MRPCEDWVSGSRPRAEGPVDTPAVGRWEHPIRRPERESPPAPAEPPGRLPAWGGGQAAHPVPLPLPCRSDAS